MSATPVDGHSDEFEQLAGLAALNVLEGNDLGRFERHAAQCERCQLMVRLDREALAAVSLVAAPMDPSPDFKARLMRRAAEELAATQHQGVGQPQPGPRPPLSALPRAGEQPGERPIPFGPRPPNVIPLWRRSPWVSALAAILVVGLVSFGAYSYENQPIATYELSGSAPGKAIVIVRRSGMAELVMDGVPDPEPGFLYEAWIIPQGGKPVAAGTTTRGNAEVPLPGNLRGSTVAITKERSRVEEPTPPVLMSTVVQS
jgi:anti-sigma-K factor RskA